MDTTLSRHISVAPCRLTRWGPGGGLRAARGPTQKTCDRYEDSHEDHQAQRYRGSLRHHQDRERHPRRQSRRSGERSPDGASGDLRFAERDGGVRERRPHRFGGGGPGPRRGRAHEARQVRGRAQVHHLPLRAGVEASEEHDRRQDPLPHRVQQRRGQAGELQQEPHRQLRAARLHGRRGLQGPHQPRAAAGRRRGGPQRGHHPLPRLRLLRPAHAQLRPREPRGHAAERHRHLRHAHRAPPQLLDGVQHRHADHRPGGLLPVRRPVHLAHAPRAVCGGQPPEDPPAGRDGALRARCRRAPG